MNIATPVTTAVILVVFGDPSSIVFQALEGFSRSASCNPIRLLMTTFNNSNNLLELSFHAYKMNPDPNPTRDNPNNLLDTVILLGYNVEIECRVWLTIGENYIYYKVSIKYYCAIVLMRGKKQVTIVFS